MALNAANKAFYIRYNDLQPVKIKTHISGDSLEDVADLIGAFKSAVVPLLNDASIANLTLHTVIDGIESPALEVDLPLRDLPHGTTPRSALIIKSTPSKVERHRDLELLSAERALEEARNKRLISEGRLLEARTFSGSITTARSLGESVISNRTLEPTFFAFATISRLTTMEDIRRLVEPVRGLCLSRLPSDNRTPTESQVQRYYIELFATIRRVLAINPSFHVKDTHEQGVVELKAKLDETSYHEAVGQVMDRFFHMKVAQPQRSV
ncbi:hypothetical protein HDV05_006344, partial [Chytridiales sp. JEL 0842]